MTDDQPPPWPPYVPLPEPQRQRMVAPLDWLIVATAAVAFGCSFFAWYTTTVTLSAIPTGVARGPEILKQWTQRADAWQGAFGWLAVTLALAAAVLHVLGGARNRLRWRVAALVTVGVATGLGLTAAAITPASPVEDDGRNALREARGFGLVVHLTVQHGRTAAFWIALAAVIVTLLLAGIRLRQVLARTARR